MPVVKNETIYFNGKEIKRRISCSSKGEFSTKLPDEIVEMFGVPQIIYGDSMEKVERSWNDMAAKFEAAKTSVRKVIICNFSAEAKIQRNGNIVFNEGTPGFMHDGIEIVFSAGVYTETTVKVDDGKSNINYKHENSSIPDSFRPSHDTIWHAIDNMRVLDWTEQREASIADLCNRFEELILRMDNIFKSDDTLLMAIAIQKNLLPG